MNAFERKRRIMEMLDKKESIEVVELTKLFGISKVTARNDLDDLEAKGLLVRTHGGAVLAEKRNFVRLVSNTLNENSDRKRRICEAAAKMVEPGQIIIIDSGSTTVHLAPLVSELPITVITNSVLVVQKLMGAEQVQLIVAGGLLRRPSMSLMGVHARHSIEEVRGDLLFLGASSVTADQGITCNNIIEADTKKAMIRSVTKVCLLVDSSKFGKVSLAKICDWDSIDILITDAIDPETRGSLEAHGVQIIIA
ncbi:MAG: DeoR family transcriptional regulator [Spirochaetae bacterium HGW-Spirochaetae-9]|nr:MAG: DeoR family transcriptional regulator [Spirochaetae bacterium HGW-Spirochaetae-9]